MKVLMFVAIPLRASASTEDVSFGSWLAAMISALLQTDNLLQLCVLCIGNGSVYDVKQGRVRYVHSDRAHFVDRVKSLIKEFKPDLIHINGTEAFYGALPMGTYGGVPTLVSLQGIINGLYPHYNGGLSPSDLRGTNFNLRYLLRRTSILNDQANWRDNLAPVERKTFAQHHHFAGRTEWDRAWVKYLNPSAHYYVVQESLRDPFYTAQRDPNKIVPHSIFCGGAAGYPLKGAHILIRAAARLKARYPDIQVRIAACRSSLSLKRSWHDRLRDTPYAIYLRRLIKDLNFQDHVVALDTLSAQGVVRELCRAELFVLPSFCENSPNSLGEAMLVGTPSIAAYVGGIPSILRNGVDGLLVQSGDVAAFAQAMDMLLSDHELANQYAVSAQGTARKHYSRQGNAGALLSIYKRILDEEQ